MDVPERETMDGSLVNVSYICTDKSGFVRHVSKLFASILKHIATFYETTSNNNVSNLCDNSPLRTEDSRK